METPCRNGTWSGGVCSSHVRQGVSCALARHSVLAASLLLSHMLGAQESVPVVATACRAHHDEAELSHLAGLVVDSIRVESRPPGRLPIADALPRRLHRLTRPDLIRRLVDVPVGAPLDTMRLARGLRELRRQRILAAVALDARECPEQRRVTLTLRTTDEWTTRGRLRVGRTRSAVSVGEENLFGSGRSLRTSLRMDDGRPGFGIHYADPWFLGLPLTAIMSRSFYRGGNEISMLAATPSSRMLDTWRVDAGWLRASRASIAAGSAAGDNVQRLETRVLVERRLWRSEANVNRLGIGAERASAALESLGSLPLIGPSHVQRDFTGALVGFSRRALSFARRSVIIGSDRLADIPRGTELDAAIGIGRNATDGMPMQHIDAWVGRAWPIASRALMVTDAWWSGYRQGSEWRAGTGRASLLGLLPTGRGQWVAHVAGEALHDPDPDVRSLTDFDPTARLLPAKGLAEGVVLFSVERVQPLRHLTRGYQLGGALFGAASRRWDLAGASADGQRGVATLGAGLRLLPTRVGRASLHLDLTAPIAGSPSSWRPTLSFSINPWFEQSRHRDGRRDP